tara:strand:- start:4007 stop:4270 length:264 start_codon:yes stop_codon:yes gene_type:complete
MVGMTFNSSEYHNEVMRTVLKEAGEAKIRKIVEDRIKDDLEGVVKELAQQFIDEFKPQVEANVYRSAEAMCDVLDVRVTSTIKKEQT